MGAQINILSEAPFGPGDLRVRHVGLENGLQVLLLRDPAAPVVAYQTWFAVGSRHERLGKTGIAHLFEHLMFNETESHPPGEFDRLIETAGGETNAATWVDWTYYRDSVPRSELELVVALESDRMAHLVVRDKQVSSEREVVMNERRFRVEDDVDGFLAEQLYKLAFTVHPYHWPTIGWMEDIRGITTDDARAFYRTYYAPNNATLVVVGDIDEHQTLSLILKHYGDIAPQPVPKPAPPPEPEQREERRQSFTKPVMADKLVLGYQSPPLTDPDYAALEVASEILFGGNSSRLYRLLVAETEIASSLHAGAAPFEYPGLYEISVALQRGHGAAEAERLIDDELERLAAEPLRPAELETARTRLLTRFWHELWPQGGKAEALGHFHTTTGDYRRLLTVPDRYHTVDEDQVHRLAAGYLRPNRRTVVLATPQGDEP